MSRENLSVGLDDDDFVHVILGTIIIEQSFVALHSLVGGDE